MGWCANLSVCGMCVCIHVCSSRRVLLQVGRTEHIKDNLNPSFTKAITVDFFFEEIQHLHFIVYDVDKPGQNLRAGGGELLGEAKTQLGKVSARVYSGVTGRGGGGETDRDRIGERQKEGQKERQRDRDRERLVRA